MAHVGHAILRDGRYSSILANGDIRALLTEGGRAQENQGLSLE